MKQVTITGDYPSWTKLREIMDEMDTLSPSQIARNPLLKRG
ncbi:hypothetical protein QG083_03915 [Kingella kingae]|nr:hypothetical protein [Kingella kingae]MDK4525363.1 hypothetical protein [Kingella kingae]MDK4527505.1 hypothetical protein [Kingella kingae]MDK4531412.1 hypothetical protein [Kingella kingae]MDK4536637.1 hypothetical protein [Kingella kingae]MDK4539073.1 hypothetical protein [Kingella kingae]